MATARDSITASLPPSRTFRATLWPTLIWEVPTARRSSTALLVRDMPKEAYAGRGYRRYRGSPRPPLPRALPRDLGKTTYNADSRSSHPVMHFTETKIAEVVFAEPDVFEDQRGLFAVAWMPEEFAARGLDTRIAQANLARRANAAASAACTSRRRRSKRARSSVWSGAPSSMWRLTCGRTRSPSCNGSAPS